MKTDLGSDDRYYFVDATHPQHTPVLDYQWAPKGQRPQVRSNSGRQRLNILGAYDAQHHDYIGLHSTDNINAQSMIDLVKRLEAHQPHGRIILICDNARYNHARLLKDYLRETQSRVELLYLPPYSPNLNLIERLWGLRRSGSCRPTTLRLLSLKTRLMPSLPTLIITPTIYGHCSPRISKF